MKHKHFQTWTLRWLLGAMIYSLLPQALLAQKYGAGKYGQCLYNAPPSGNCLVSLLPNTGAGMIGLASLLLAAILFALLVWRRSRASQAKLDS